MAFDLYFGVPFGGPMRLPLMVEASSIFRNARYLYIEVKGSALCMIARSNYIQGI